MSRILNKKNNEDTMSRNRYDVRKPWLSTVLLIVALIGLFIVVIDDNGIINLNLPECSIILFVIGFPLLAVAYFLYEEAKQ